MKTRHPVVEIKFEPDAPVTKKSVREWTENAVASHLASNPNVGGAKIASVKVRKVDQD